jgi:hypothetical protein
MQDNIIDTRHERLKKKANVDPGVYTEAYGRMSAVYKAVEHVARETEADQINAGLEQGSKVAGEFIDKTIIAPTNEGPVTPEIATRAIDALATNDPNTLQSIRELVDQSYGSKN